MKNTTRIIIERISNVIYAAYPTISGSPVIIKDWDAEGFTNRKLKNFIKKQDAMHCGNVKWEINL